MNPQKKMKKNRYAGAVRLGVAALLAAVLLSLPAFAAGRLDPSFETRLEIRFVMDGTPVRDLPFTVHKIAEWDGTTKFTMDARYAAYEAIDLDGMKGNDAWLHAATTLTEKLRADQNAPAPAGTAKTNADGNVSFEGCRPGVYLIYSDWVKIGDYKYAAVPYFAILPAVEKGKNEWSPVYVSYPKRQKLPDYTKLNVLKVWDDKGYESRRPSEVTVHLLKNGTVVETRKLNAAGSWKCTFENLSKEAVYTVTEDTVSNYTTRIRMEGITCVVTNKRKTSGSNVIHPASPGSTKVETEVFSPLLTASDGPADTGLTAEQDSFKPNLVLGAAASKLPQTGLLWWPVFVLAVTGIFLIVVGSITEKK